MKKYFLLACVCGLLSWPSQTNAQKIVSQNNKETNGAEKYGSQSKNSAGYSVMRDGTAMSHARSRAMSTANGAGKQIEKQAKESEAASERARIQKEVADRNKDKGTTTSSGK
jgi:hypothetical protein